MRLVRVREPGATFEPFAEAPPIAVRTILKDHSRCYFWWESKVTVPVKGHLEKVRFVCDDMFTDVEARTR